jgi:dipeptidyl aminopeptidase/acylaminoacyl peptidase
MSTITRSAGRRGRLWGSAAWLAAGVPLVAAPAPAHAQAPQVVWSRPLPYPPRALDLTRTGDRLAVALGRGPCQPGEGGGQCPGIGGWQLIDPATGATTGGALPYTAGSPNDIAFSPDGSLLGLAYLDPELRRTADGGLVHQLVAGGANSFEAAFSGDGSRFFVGTTPGFGPAVHVFSTATGETTNTFGLVNFVTSMAVSPNGARLATANGESVVMVFDIGDPDHERLVLALENPNPWQPTDPYPADEHIYAMAFTADGSVLATTSFYRVNLWRVADGTLIRTFVSPEVFPNQVSGEFFQAVGISPDGGTLAAGGFKAVRDFMQDEQHGSLNVWRIADGELLGRYQEGVAGSVRDAAFSRDGRVIYFVSDGPPTPGPAIVAAILNPGAGAACPADVDGDGVVTIQDFLSFLSLYAGGDPRADIDGDGALTIQDFLGYLALFAAGC